MTTELRPNYSINIDYMIHQCLGISYTEKSYHAGITIPRLDISFSTLKIILSGNGRITKNGKVVSEKTIQKIASAFSMLLVHPEERRIFAEDLDLDPEDFKELFPPSAFIQKAAGHPSVSMMKFTNKLYRGYYMLPNSPHKAYLAYFKLVEKEGRYRAYLVRGIQDFDRARDICNYFDTPEELEQCMKSKEGGKEMETIHLYKAWNDTSARHMREDIRITRNCIKIDFHSVEEDPCYVTMFWNICLSAAIESTDYIGGSALMVDTNDGKRGKTISAFKMGLEAVEDIPASQRRYIERGPLVSDAPRVIKELSLESENGVMSLGNSDDSRWFRFIQNDNYREQVYNRYADIDVDALIDSLVSLKTELQHEIAELKRNRPDVGDGSVDR